jgi:ATP-dependent RNA helicase DDX49/DBP8
MAGGLPRRGSLMRAATQRRVLAVGVGVSLENPAAGKNFVPRIVWPRRQPRPFPISLPMAAPLTIRRLSDGNGSSSSRQSDSDSQSDAGSGRSARASPDSQRSRKRRKLSLVDDDDDDEPFVPRLAVPSRTARSQPSTLTKTSEIPANNAKISAPTDPQTTFAALDVKPWLVGSLGAMAIKRPTGIQKHCIPEILKGRDCIGGSRTGSGKTVAFAVPILQKWAGDPFGIFALVLTPTR